MYEVKIQNYYKTVNNEKLKTVVGDAYYLVAESKVGNSVYEINIDENLNIILGREIINEWLYNGFKIQLNLRWFAKECIQVNFSNIIKQLLRTNSFNIKDKLVNTIPSKFKRSYSYRTILNELAIDKNMAIANRAQDILMEG